MRKFRCREYEWAAYEADEVEAESAKEALFKWLDSLDRYRKEGLYRRKFGRMVVTDKSTGEDIEFDVHVRMEYKFDLVQEVQQ